MVRPLSVSVRLTPACTFLPICGTGSYFGGYVDVPVLQDSHLVGPPTSLQPMCRTKLSRTHMFLPGTPETGNQHAGMEALAQASSYALSTLNDGNLKNTHAIHFFTDNTGAIQRIFKGTPGLQDPRQRNRQPSSKTWQSIMTTQLELVVLPLRRCRLETCPRRDVDRSMDLYHETSTIRPHSCRSLHATAIAH